MKENKLKTNLKTVKLHHVHHAQMTLMPSIGSELTLVSFLTPN
jgi:hypothetical protein